MSVDLRNARIIEAGAPEQNGILIRAKPGDPFTRIGGVEEGRPEAHAAAPQFLESVLAGDRGITVLAEFDNLTLSDLLPEGCEAFRFNCGNTPASLIATLNKLTGVWEVTERHSNWSDLNDMTTSINVDLSTVVPLELRIHPQCVEERR